MSFWEKWTASTDITMKILKAAQIRAADAYTIRHEPIASIDLMERAAQTFTDWCLTHLDFGEKAIVIYCGTGNNGGDGLAIARILSYKGFSVEVTVVHSEKPGAEDFKANLARYETSASVRHIVSVGEVPEQIDGDIVIDALFGTGLSRSLEGLHVAVIEAINAGTSQVIAVDIASGLFSDGQTPGTAIVRPRYTLSFQVPKLAFVIPENEPYVGEWHVLDIGLHKGFLESEATPYYLFEVSAAAALLTSRKKYAHKGDFGRALLIAGSYGKMGAAILAGKAALRSGLGLLTLHAPKAGYAILQTAVPEAMVSVDDAEHYFSNLPYLEPYGTIGIGPGLDQQAATHTALTALLHQSKHPMVLDADALNIISVRRELLEALPSGSILTPHPKEFERLAGGFDHGFDRLELQRSFSMTYGVYVVLKGAHTALSTPEGSVYFNTTGNPGMATAGSGDVLTGVITALLAQGHTPEVAALLGICLHGLAGDLAKQEKGEVSLIASDIIEFLPAAFGFFNGSRQ